MKNLDELIAYFAKITNEYTPHKMFFMHAPTDAILRLLSEQSGNITYPALMLETPDFQISANRQNLGAKPLLAFAILSNAQKDDYTEQAEKIQMCYQIFFDFWERILTDTSGRKLGFAIDSKKYYDLKAVSPASVDFVLGYRFEFELEYSVSTCQQGLAQKWKNYGTA